MTGYSKDSIHGVHWDECAIIYIYIYTPHLYYIHIIHAPIIVVSSNFQKFANIDVRSVDQQPVKNHVILCCTPIITVILCCTPFYNSMKPSLDHMSFLRWIFPMETATSWIDCEPSRWRGLFHLRGPSRGMALTELIQCQGSRVHQLIPTSLWASRKCWTLGPRKFLVLGSEMLVKCWW